MKIVVFGLTISSSWGNGHATIWRGLLRELIGRGHDVTFFEHDVPYYAAFRDLQHLPGGMLHIYSSWPEVAPTVECELNAADVALVSSYCPDAIEAAEAIKSSDALRVFYDLDTPVTISRLRRGETVPYLPANGLSNFDLVLSFTGGGALDYLREELGAPIAVALYGSVDPGVHRPVLPNPRYAADLSYLGTYSADRQSSLRDLFLEPARRLPARRFLIGGAQYPPEFPWLRNVFFVQHLAPGDHSSFFCSSSLTLNVTRGAMRDLGWCPSGRLFEAAACGAPMITDWWEGLDQFFEPDSEILIAQSADDVIAALQTQKNDLTRMAQAARERVLTEHTAAQRAREFEQIMETARSKEMAAA